MSLRTRILAAVLVPSVLLLTVGIVLSTRVVADALDQRARAEAIAVSGRSSLAFFPLLMEERAASIRFHADPSSLNRASMREWRAEVDARLQDITTAIRDVGQHLPAEALAGAESFATAAAGLPQVRQSIDADTVDRLGIYRFYNDLTRVLGDTTDALMQVASDATAASAWAGAADLLRAADELGRGNALATAALTAGDMSRPEFDEFLQSAGVYIGRLDAVSSRLGESDRAELARLRDGEQWRFVASSAATVLGAGFPGAVTSGVLPAADVERWRAASETVVAQVMQLGVARSTAIAQQEAVEADTAARTSTLAAVGMLAVLVVLVMVAFVLTNRVVGRLTRLHRETVALSDRVLPDAVARLRRGEKLDLAEEFPQLDRGADEIGQVALAFNDAQRTAVAAAIEEAQTRAGFNEAFLNIARRSQAILHRQMQVLDRIERAETNPDQLELLFQLDHLATRERRNAENLIILGGERPRRQWRAPVPLHELVRGAIGEAEQYQRIALGRVPPVMVTGPAVGDLVHLLAELLDNATAFSPPDAATEVHGTMAGRGVVIEVEDKGLGIQPEHREQLNALLHNPPDFGLRTLSRDARVGLFVVARLARRHGVVVTLRDSVYGGVRAAVLIPNDLLVRHAGSGAGPGSGPGITGPTDPETTDTTLPPVPAEPPARQAPDIPPARSQPDAPAEERPRRTPAPTADIQSWPPPAMRGHGHGAATGLPTLPRRRRKTHMAARLRDAIPPAATAGRDGPADAEYTPELARSRMSALRRGTLRGRTERPENTGPPDSAEETT